MTFAHESIASNPVSGNVDKAGQRAMFTRRFAYCLSADENAGDFVAVDPASGVMPYYLIQNGALFELDPSDSTTMPDGTTCLVTSDAKRYKANAVTYPWSVISILDEQPEDPTEGDRHLVDTAATGDDFAGRDGDVAMFASGRWQFATIPIGRELYVEDENRKYYRNAVGTWTIGIGAVGFANGSIPITAIIGTKASFVVKVVNTTTNTPPPSPVAPVAYVVGTLPAGDWSAWNPGDLAVCLSDGVFTRIVPAEGDEIYNIASKLPLRWNGTAWEASAGLLVQRKDNYTQSQFTATTGSGTYNYSTSTPPANQNRVVHGAPLEDYAAKKVGNILIFEFEGVFEKFQETVIGGLRRDGETNCIGWSPKSLKGDGINDLVPFRFRLVAADTLQHDYSFNAFYETTTGSPLAIGHSLFSVSEFTP